MLDVSNKLMFSVGVDGVYLHYGPIGVIVCKTPDEFNAVRQQLVMRLDKIATEIREKYILPG